MTNVVFEPEKVEKELAEFYCLIPNLNFEALERGEYDDALKYYYGMGLALTEAKASPLAHYILASLHCIGGEAPFYNLEAAKEQRLKAGYLGHGVAMYDYGQQVRYSTDESLAFLKILVDNQAGVAGVREDFLYLMNKKDESERERIAQLADEIMKNIHANGLSFEFD